MFIKAIPTKYEGVQFRSRLEARWAAFFDQCKWNWDYEPIDLDGWAPDFVLHTPHCSVYAEVKPEDAHGSMFHAPAFAKAVAHWQNVQVLLLGLSPRSMPHCIGSLLDPPQGSYHAWANLNDFLTHASPTARWRRAGNLVQWKARRQRTARAAEARQ